jgi:hypothetical protein
MGLSSYPNAGYDKKTQGQDIAAVMDKLGVKTAGMITSSGHWIMEEQPAQTVAKVKAFPEKR